MRKHCEVGDVVEVKKRYRKYVKGCKYLIIDEIHQCNLFGKKYKVKSHPQIVLFKHEIRRVVPKNELFDVFKELMTNKRRGKR